MTSRSSTAAPILAVLAIVLTPLVLYVAGYLWLGERRDWHWRDGLATIERTYPQPWMVAAFQPAGWVEEQLQNVEVAVTLGTNDRNETPTNIFTGEPR